MCKTFFISLFMLLWVSWISASEPASTASPSTSNWELGITGGTTVTQAIPYDFSFIRALGGSYSDQYVNLDAQTQELHAGLALEKRFPNSRFAIATGIQYTKRTSWLGRNLYEYGMSDEFFYVLLQSEGTQTDLTKVNSVKEELTYLSVPLEGRIYPFEPRLFNLFFGLGVEYGYLIDSQVNVNFHAQQMDPFNDEVAALFNAPSDYFLSGYGTVGFVLNKTNHLLTMKTDSISDTLGIIDGFFHIKRVQNLRVDQVHKNIILSGEFAFKALQNDNPITISDGRFDFALSDYNFYRLNQK